jgi:hypothetical protein
LKTVSLLLEVGKEHMDFVWQVLYTHLLTGGPK